MITNPVALMFWSALSVAFAFGVYEATRHALAIHRSRFVPKRTSVQGTGDRVSIVMEGPYFSRAILEFTSTDADEIGRALISAAEAMRGRS